MKTSRPLRGSTFSRKLNRAGFSLVELLVAMAVLSLIGLAIAQIVSVMQRTFRAEHARLSSLGEASFGLDRIQLDMSSLILRPDLPVYLKKKASNDELGFYSSVDAATGSRKVSAIIYRIKGGNLERGALGMDWSGNGKVIFNQAAFPTIPEAEFQIVAIGVFRMEITFIRKSDGRLVQSAPASTDLSGIVVALASVDENALLKINSTQIQSASDALPDVADGKYPLKTWNDTTFVSSPPAAFTPLILQNLRFYQRTFNIP